MGVVFFGGGKVGMKKPSTSRLPSGYTELEYIQSSGTQYINTGVKPNQDSRIVFDAQMLEGSSSSKTLCFFGCRDGTNFWEIHKAGTGQEMYHFWGPTYGPYWTINYTTRHTMELNKNVGIFDGSKLTYTYTTFQINYNVFLGSCNNGGSATSTAAMKIYSCQIYNNGTLVRDFVPCISDAEGVGLYDLANNKFYGNAGSGSFVGGPEV